MKDGPEDDRKVFSNEFYFVNFNFTYMESWKVTGRLRGSFVRVRELYRIVRDVLDRSQRRW